MAVMADDWTPGSRLLEHYDVERDLGSGGFGHVVLVRDRRTGHPYAVKRLRSAEHEFQTRFRVEAQRWIDLGGHPHVVRCHFVRTVQDAPAIFSEYVDGGSLADWIADKRLYHSDNGPPLRRVLRIAIHAAWGIEAAHRRGLLHLDVKPSNVLLTQDGDAKLADFGLATAVAATPGERLAEEAMLDQLTNFMPDQGQRDALKSRIAQTMASNRSPDETLEVIGREGLSRGYASPEQARGARMTRASDLWSWAATTLEMFAGARSWPSGPDAGIALERLTSDASVPQALDLPQAIAAVLRECLNPRASARPSITQVADRLADLYREIEGEPLRDDRPPGRTSLEEIWETRPREPGAAMRWADPRGWLAMVCEAAGVPPEEAVERWPSREGSLHAQLIGELNALIDARRILVPVVGGDRDLQIALGHLTADIGRARWALGDRERAIEDHEEASRVLEAAGDAARLDRAVVLAPLASSLRELGRQEEALQAATTAVELCRGVPLDDHGRATLAVALTATAEATVDVRAAVVLYDEAIELFERVGDEARRVEALAEKMVRLQLGKEPGVDWAHVDAEIETLVENGVPDALPLKAMVRFNRALQASSYAERLHFARAAVEVYTPLVTERRLFTHAGELGRSHLMSGQGQEQAGDLQAAVRSYGLAREFLEQAVVEHGQRELAPVLAAACDHESTLVRDFGDPRDAVLLAQRACEIWQRLADADGSRTWRVELATARGKLASCLGDAGDLHAGLRELDAAEGLFAGDVEVLRDPPARQEIAAIHSARGVLLRQMGRPEAAADSYQAGLRILEGWSEPDDRLLQARLLGNLGNALVDAGAYGAGLDASEGALAIWESLDDGEGTLRVSLTEARHDLAKKLAAAGEYRRAVECADAAEPLYGELIAHGRDDLDGKLTALLGLRALMLERAGDIQGALARLREAHDRYDPERDVDMLEATSYRMGLLEQIVHVDPREIPGWAGGAHQYMRKLRQALARDPDDQLTAGSLEDLAGHLDFLRRLAPGGAVLGACAEAAAGTGLLAAQAGRDAAARHAFARAMQCSKALAADEDDLRELDHPLLIAAALTLERGTDAEAAALADRLHGVRLDPANLSRVPWTLLVTSELTELRTGA